MALPLDGIRVVEMCQVYAGPYAAMMLADLGADVIKLEPPEGDSNRATATAPYPGFTIPFLAFNRNKRSIVVNYQTSPGRNVAYRLFKQADVLLIATRAATRGRWGLTYEEVSAVNPRLIYASITGFGEQGPDYDQPGIDLVVQARSGDAGFRHAPYGTPPSSQSLFHFDMATSMLTVGSVALALRQRDSTGRGQKLELSLLQSALASHAVNMMRVVGTDNGGPVKNTGGQRVYRCSDDRYIFASPIADRWPAYCRALGLDQLIEDARFDTGPKRQQNAEALYQIVSQQLSTRPAAEWEAKLKEANEYASVVKEMAEVRDDPQVIANQMLTTFEQPGVGIIETVNTPFKMSASAGEPWFRRPVPGLGEHTNEIVTELGYSQKELASLRAEGAIG